MEKSGKGGRGEGLGPEWWLCRSPDSGCILKVELTTLPNWNGSREESRIRPRLLG